MREEAIFFEQQVSGRRIAVFKTYDARTAREAFDDMSQEALETLQASLDLQAKVDSADIPAPHDEAFADFLWEIVQEDAREDWNSFSYFIVREQYEGRTMNLFVSSDWLSAEAFAKNTLAVLA